MDAHPLTLARKLDTMQGMPIPQNPIPIDLDLETVTRLAFRAIWLHGQIAGAPGAALVPRDRDVIAYVATRPNGVREDELIEYLSSRGGDPARVHRLSRLVDQGFLARYPSTPTRVDLPPADLEWIERSSARLHAGPAEEDDDSQRLHAQPSEPATTPTDPSVKGAGR